MKNLLLLATFLLVANSAFATPYRVNLQDPGEGQITSVYEMPNLNLPTINEGFAYQINDPNDSATVSGNNQFCTARLSRASNGRTNIDIATRFQALSGLPQQCTISVVVRDRSYIIDIFAM